MIALYKLEKPIEEKISLLLNEYDVEPEYFYSLNSILNQIMKPLIIITPIIYMKELESLSIPIIPLMIHLTDVECKMNQLVDKTANETVFVATEEEIKSLKLELKLRNQQKKEIKDSFIFINRDKFSQGEISKNNFYLLPIWHKITQIEKDFETKYQYIEPSITTLSSVVNHAVHLLNFTNEMLRKKFEVEAVVASSHDGIIAVDKQGVITLANDMAKKMLGFEGQEMVGKKITEFIPHSDMIRILETGKKEQGDFTILQDKKVIVNRLPVMINNNVVGAVSNIKYYTNIQKMELKLRKMLHNRGLEAKYSLNNIVGESKEITLAKEQAKIYAETDATVLITGETGTGKELFAQGIHLESSRTQGPFVAVNCAALPESLLESELFGYEEGAFTGARKGGKPGLFEQAHGGTLFLDEIGEMPPRIQALLLRVLQEKTVRRIGGEKITPIDVRIIAATNRNLEDEIDAGRFRADLYYRINVLSLEIPPLRKRLQDIPVLVESFVNQFNEQREKKIEKIDKEVYEPLMEYKWPGNIRELRNVVERMILLEKGTILSKSNLVLPKRRSKSSNLIEEEDNLNIKNIERKTIIEALEKFQFNKTKAAKFLGIDRSTLWRKIKEYDL